MKKVKTIVVYEVNTSKESQYGQSIILNVDGKQVALEFDGEGVADVKGEDIALALIEKYDFLSIDDEEGEETEEAAEEVPAEEAPAEEEKKEEASEAKKVDVKETANEDGESEADTETKDDKGDNSSDDTTTSDDSGDSSKEMSKEDKALFDELDKKKIKTLQAIAKDGGLDKKEWGELEKEDLIKYILDH